MIMRKKNLFLIASFALASLTAPITYLFLQHHTLLQNIGEDIYYEKSVTLYASDISAGLSNGGLFQKDCLSFKCINMATNGDRIIFKGVGASENPCLQVLTGSIPNGDGTLSGQGYKKVIVTGFDGEGYGQLGINSYEEADGNGWIGYQQFLPKENQEVIPKTTEEKPIAKYIYFFGKVDLDLSLTSIKITWDCGATSESEPEDPEETKEYYAGEPIVTFNESVDESGLYTVKHGYSNGGMFLSEWNRNNFTVSDNVANMSLSDNLIQKKNYGAEIKSTNTYQYGYFGARIKAFQKAGTVQSIFTCTSSEEHDEIDIEILGKDTTKVQFNYYNDGVGEHEYVYDLGFDASTGFHDYGFEWESNKITWFIDNIAVYSVAAEVDEPQYLLANVWAGNNSASGISDWLGEYVADNQTYTAKYDYLSYAPLNATPILGVTSPLPGDVIPVTDGQVSNYIKDFKKKGSKKANDYLLDINEVNTTSHTPRVSAYTTGSNLSKGKPITISFNTNLTGQYKVYLSENSDFSNAKMVETNSKNATFYNSYIATDYYVKVTNNSGSKESLVHKFITEDSVRMVYTSKTYNIRDIGGKMTRSGKRIKQGLIYRGQELVTEDYTDTASSPGSHVQTVDTSSLNTLLNELGISLELDFRSTTELPDPNNIVSPIGIDYWHGSSVSSSGWVPSYNYISRDKNNLKMYRNIFQQFLNADHKVIYFHCWGGLDRTGTVAFILEGLLGCSFTDMCIDYELSSFSGSGALRQRDVDYQSGGKGFKTMVTQLVNNTSATDTFNGYNPDGTNDIQEICENILLTAGMTITEINQIRDIMLED